jgi:NitT/TauT family transport system permease protein
MAGLPWKAVSTRATTPIMYLVLTILWEAGVRLFDVPGWILPAPTAIIAIAKQWAPELLYNSYITVQETVIGFVLALVLSLPLAIIIAFTSTTRRLLYPILLGLQSVPKVALAPLVILWLGIGNWPKIVIVILVCFFPILVNVVAGFEAVPKPMLDLMYSLRASKLAIFRRLRAPVAMPHLFTGCKVAITFAVIGAVIGEFVAAQEGLGYMILMSTAQSLTPLAFAAIILLTVISVVLFYAVEILERRLVTWRP